MRFDIHVHSNHSDGRPSPAEIVEYAKGRLDGVAITDHNTIDGSLEALKYAGANFTVIPGVEVSSNEGHILALGVNELIQRDLSAQETVERIHALGGLAVAAHPYDTFRSGVGDLILELPFDAVEVVNGHTFGNRRDPVRVCSEAGLPMVGGSDAHSLREIGSVTNRFEGDWMQAVKRGDLKVESSHPAKRAINFGLGVIDRRLL
jgi:predicted metal-dependent phosphoesterase TrpH